MWGRTHFPQHLNLFVPGMAWEEWTRHYSPKLVNTSRRLIKSNTTQDPLLLFCPTDHCRRDAHKTCPPDAFLLSKACTDDSHGSMSLPISASRPAIFASNATHGTPLCPRLAIQGARLGAPAPRQQHSPCCGAPTIPILHQTPFRPSQSISSRSRQTQVIAPPATASEAGNLHREACDRDGNSRPPHWPGGVCATASTSRLLPLLPSRSPPRLPTCPHPPSLLPRPPLRRPAHRAPPAA